MRSQRKRRRLRHSRWLRVQSCSGNCFCLMPRHPKPAVGSPRFSQYFEMPRAASVGSHQWGLLTPLTPLLQPPLPLYPVAPRPHHRPDVKPFWDNMYLSGRYPVPINSNPFVAFMPSILRRTQPERTVAMMTSVETAPICFAIALLLPLWEPYL